MSTVASKPAVHEALSDEDVVRRVRAGETALFEILMRRHNQRLYRASRAILRDEVEAEDVMQQAYVNAYAHLDQFEDRASFATWLTRIAVHEALARVRRRGRFAEMDVMGESDEIHADREGNPDPERQAYAGEVRRALEAALDALPLIYRSVFMLRDVEGMSTQEAADCLAVTQETVKTRLHRARALLREELFSRAGLTARDAFPFLVPRCDRIVAAVLARVGQAPPHTLH
jgi:RNA polymerase sigma-70 factor, ECF subfamily